MKHVEKETLISEFIIDSTLNDDNIYSINMIKYGRKCIEYDYVFLQIFQKIVAVFKLCYLS